MPKYKYLRNFLTDIADFDLNTPIGNIGYDLDLICKYNIFNDLDRILYRGEVKEIDQDVMYLRRIHSLMRQTPVKIEHGIVEGGADICEQEFILKLAKVLMK